MKKLFYLPFIIAILVFGVQRAAAEESCLITVDTPTAGQTIGTSFTLSGSIQSYDADNTGCEGWAVQPGSIGTLSLYDSNNALIAGPIQLTGPQPSGYPDFIYTYPIVFSQAVTTGKEVNGTGKLVISDYTENDQEEEEGTSTKTIPVVFQSSSTAGIALSLPPTDDDATNMPSAPSDFTFKKPLKYGMKGDADVMELQNILKRLGFFTVEANGNFGPVTKKAVLLYQQYRGLPQVGSVGPLTRNWLNKEL